MYTKLQKISLIFFLFLLITAPVPAYSAEVISISIKARHTGLSGIPSGSDFEIILTPDGYKGTLGLIETSHNIENLEKEGLLIKSGQDSWRINEEKSNTEEITFRIQNDKQMFPPRLIPKDKIEEFLKTLSTQPINKLNPDQLIINQEWLQNIATKLINKQLDTKKDYYFFAKSKLPILIKELSNIQKVRLRIRSYYSNKSFDDYPKVKAIIKFANKQTIALSSDAQQIYMIPWKIKKNGNEYINYDVQISKALDNLLPESFSEKERIQGDLIEVFEDHIWRDEIWNFLETVKWEYELRGQIDFIKNDFILINGKLRKTDYNFVPSSVPMEEDSIGKWEITLSHGEWPKNVLVTTSFPYLSGRIEHERFSHQKVHSYIEKLLEIKWLKKYIKNHPNDEFYVNISNDRSITPEDFSVEMKQLKLNRNYEWKLFGLPYHADIISLSIYNKGVGSSEWLIFPDKTSTLHSFRGERVLNWSTKELSRWKKHNTHYSGIRISPDGKIMHP